ncbi:MAG: 3-dehydroquinate synthase [Eubacteriales bacterium]|nr:3-dehydroquinate synthase [Eubacteriales bacterium]
MKTLEIASSRPYKVLIGSDLLAEVGTQIKKIGEHEKIAVICDDVTAALFGARLKESLEKSGAVACFFSFPNGETSKNITTLQQIYSFLLREEITRSDLIIALGGGVVGDITGFAAATYLRGIDYVQIPTTLISQTDSSVGGKTAVNLPEGKNLCGCFHSPRLVICDTGLLKESFLIREGIAEVIKCALLADPELFSMLENGEVATSLDEIVTRAIAIKGKIVAADEWDVGERQLLNLGHTLGHGVEKCSNFTVPHGIAVAIGMSMILSACVANGLLDESVLKRLHLLYKRFDLPSTYDGATLEEIIRVAFSDKKRFGGDINLIVCSDIGACSIKKMPISQLDAFVRRGWSGR